MTLDHPVLDQVVLSSSTLFDAKRQPMAVRLTVAPLRSDARIDAAGVLALAGAIAPPGAGQLVLAVAAEGALRELLATELPSNVLLEVPGFLLSDPALAEA